MPNLFWKHTVSMCMGRSVAKRGQKEAQANGEEGLPFPREEEVQKSIWKDGGLEPKFSL